MSPDNVLALECSNHGFTVGTHQSAVHLYGCRVHAGLMYLSMPVGSVLLWNLLRGNVWMGLAHGELWFCCRPWLQSRCDSSAATPIAMC